MICSTREENFVIDSFVLLPISTGAAGTYDPTDCGRERHITAHRSVRTEHQWIESTADHLSQYGRTAAFLTTDAVLLLLSESVSRAIIHPTRCSGHTSHTGCRCGCSGRSCQHIRRTWSSFTGAGSDAGVSVNRYTANVAQY